MSVIEAISLTKTYRLKHHRAHTEFTALNDVSFSVSEGESVGIIGQNGAGKSTLLKVLSEVTLPTAGTAAITGTFASLLEVGTGFHPDLSGRDNIFLNASIIGIPKQQAQQELENIIAFAGIGSFINEPLRTYSSGMKLRLAFSVLAFLKTDIIALDEVLAVGDSTFQLKCMERIFGFQQQGRTILFVSHNLSAVKKLCQRTLVLEKGKLVFDGPTKEAINFYLNRQESEVESTNTFLKKVTITSLTDVPDKNKSAPTTILRNAQALFEIGNLPADAPLDLGVNISDADGNAVYHFSNRFINQQLIPTNGQLKLKLRFKHSLKPGRYTVAIYLGQNHQDVAWIPNAYQWDVAPYNPYGFHNAAAIQAPVITDFSIVSM